IARAVGRHYHRELLSIIQTRGGLSPRARVIQGAFMSQTEAKTQILTMLELQDGMNSKVSTDWRSAGFAWHRAIWVECAELMDHHGWKWWKKQTPDTEQVALELIDIWHFGLSIMLSSGLSHDQI